MTINIRNCTVGWVASHLNPRQLGAGVVCMDSTNGTYRIGRSIIGGGRLEMDSDDAFRGSCFYDVIFLNAGRANVALRGRMLDI